MKKSILFFGILISALSLTSCSTDSYDIEDKSTELAKIQMIKDQNFVETIAIETADETTVVYAKEGDTSNAQDGQPVSQGTKKD